MQIFSLKECGFNGWFIGDFPEAAVKTKDFEVAFVTKARSYQASHFHKDITEVLLITRGSMLINGKIIGPGQLVVVQPGEISQIEILEETDTVAIKFPSIPGDKHLL